MKPHGVFNAEKCIRYLRWIGVEIDDKTAAEWLDMQKLHRFLASMKRTAAQGWDWWCDNGHQIYVEHRRGQRRASRFRSWERRCEVCGAEFRSGKARWYELRDGSIRDLRPKDERWKALDWQPPPLGNDPPSMPEIGV